MTALIGVVCLALGIAGESVARLAGAYARAPWCWCTHARTVHEHDRPGNDCSQCTCARFAAPFFRRRPCT